MTQCCSTYIVSEKCFNMSSPKKGGCMKLYELEMRDEGMVVCKG